MEERKFPRKDLTTWELIIKAPFSASGCDEVLMTAVYKTQLQMASGRKKYGPNSMYTIRRKDSNETERP